MAQQPVVEIWTWYSVALFFVILRTVARRVLRGAFRFMQFEDFLMLAVILPYTGLAAVAHVIRSRSSDAGGGDAIPLSKLGLAADVCLNVTLVMTKACLLIMFGRLSDSKVQRIAMQLTAVYIAICFVLTEVLYFTAWCRPMSRRSSLFEEAPDAQDQCVTDQRHFILSAVFNASSTLIILGLMTHLLITMQFHTMKKIVHGAILTIGLFSVISTILNNYFAVEDRYSDRWVLWLMREPSAAVLCANLPLLWPLVQLVFKLCGGYNHTRAEAPEFPDYPKQSELKKNKKKKKPSRWARFIAMNRAPIGDMVISRPNPTLATWQEVGIMTEKLPDAGKDPWKDVV